MVFSEARQKVYELNDTAAYIWRALWDGREPASVVDQIIEQGIDQNTAESYVRYVLGEWNRLGIRPASLIPTHSTRGNPQIRQQIRLANLRIGIRFWTPHADHCARVFRHLEIKGTTPDVLVDVVNRGPEHHIFKSAHWIDACSAEELAPVLKGRLMTEVLERGSYELALHTASLVRNKRLLLICGPPGAGKTTLTLALVHAGFGFAGDDLALLDSSGWVTGIPFAAAVKAGAWPLVASFQPHVLKLPIFRRPDRKRVRYMAPYGPISTRARRVDWLVLLRRSGDGNEALLRPLDLTDALRAILEGGYAPYHRLTSTGFAALISAIEEAQCFCLSYSRLEDAVARLQEACG